MRLEIWVPWFTITPLAGVACQQHSFTLTKMAQKQKMSSHTIILYQLTTSPQSRTYRDYESVRDSMGGICEIFEDKLKREHRGQSNISYGVKDLFNWIDEIGDMGALVYNHSIGGYEPKNKEWIKEKVYRHLQRMAREAQQ
eukprot:TRINITY_DN4584_c0_g1_i1.p2 TRINITY_DN4584_c0_g1~~TRINITY_DN4584_c0_g1_i1.p2  ORF type:complete len:141 (-),score=24.38 TRINITY_DN4584_c0_g1_i1:110-532(-)